MHCRASSIIFSLGAILLMGCYEIETVIQPALAFPDSSFTTHLTISLTAEDSTDAVPNFGVLLPVGWSMNDTIPFVGDLNGVFVYDSLFSDSASSLWTPPSDYFWWVGHAVDTVDSLPDGSFTISPLIFTSAQTGICSIQYRLGDDYPHSDETEHGFLGLSASELIFITPNQTTLTGDVYVSTDGTLGGSGTALDPLSTIIEAMFRLSADSLNPGIIHLANGLYSPSSTGEYFPIETDNYISISGESEAGVILDAERVTSVMRFDHTSQVTVSNLTLTGGSAVNGGGIYFLNSNPILSHVTITGNSASNDGGGIYCRDNSNPTLSDATIRANSAGSGGGIYCHYNSSVIFSIEHRCNIYLNNIISGNGGADIYSNTFLEVLVDTFTVLQPTGYYVLPVDSFSFDILNSIQEQVNADLFLSPAGDNTNDGLTAETAIQTIEYASSIIFADSLNPRTLHLANGTYSPSTTGENFPIDIMEYLSISGESEAGVILDAGGNARVMTFKNIEQVTVSNLTLTGGFAHYGGGISCIGSNPTLSNVTIAANEATSRGGGIYATQSSPNLENMIIMGNTAGSGGGIFCWYSHPTISNTTIESNAAGPGGGIYCYGANPTLSNVTIASNTASDGGGIFCNNNSNPKLSHVAITGNISTSDGGGIHFAGSSSSPAISNIIITGNTAGNKGGGIYSFRTNLVIINGTLAANSAGYGDGIYCRISNLALINSILWSDRVVFHFNTVPGHADSILVAYSLFQGGLNGISTNDSTTIYWEDGNIIPVDTLNVPFIDPDNGNYSLQEGSLCIDAGTAFFAWQGDTLVNLSSDDYVSVAPDMGAYEYSTPLKTHNITILPHKYALDQNFPNPFNPTTTISYALPEQSAVTLTVFNILGQEVMTLQDAVKPVGNYEVQWYGMDASGNPVSTGVYFARLQAGDYHQTIKMIYLK